MSVTRPVPSPAACDPGRFPDPLLSWRQRFEHWSPWTVMAVALGLSLLVALALRLVWGSRFPFLPFFPAVAFCAIVSGWRYAIAATVLSTVFAAGFYAGRIDTGFVMAVAVYLVSNALLIALAESARRAIVRAEAGAAAALESERRFRVMADSVPLMIWVHDAAGRILFVNRPWEEFFGPTQDEARRSGWQALVHDEDRDRYVKAFEDAVRQRQPFHGLARVRRADGRWRWVESHGVPRLGARGELLSFAGTSHDVTERREFELEREALLESERAARGEAESATRAKDEFLATLSHELRTPLSVIVLWSRILARKYATQDGELRKGLALIIDNGMALSKLIGDLLEMSRIVAGRVTLDLRQVDAVDLVTQAVASHRPAAEARQVAIETEVGPEAKIVLGDPTRLQQVLWNLLSNAVKFTPEHGHVRVTLHKRDDRLEIGVHDDGEGIEPEALTQIFNRFRQADNSTTRRHGGLGLGLAIVKQLVELHGGQVRAESAGPGQGASFVVTLPLHESSLPLDLDSSGSWRRLDPDRLLSARLDGRRVLAVEDQPDMLESLRDLLEDQGAIVTTAGSGQRAMELLRERPDDFDVLISDIGMPGMDGYELLRRVRADLGLGPQKLVAIALTAYARDQDRERALQAGFHAHVTKPYQVGQLVAILNQLLPPAPTTAAAATDAADSLETQAG